MVYTILWRSQHNEPAQMQWWLKGWLLGFRGDVIHTSVLNAGSCRQWAVWKASHWSQTDAILWGLSKGGSIRAMAPLWGRWEADKVALAWSKISQSCSFTKQQSSARFGMIHIFLHFCSSRVTNSNSSLYSHATSNINPSGLQLVWIPVKNCSVWWQEFNLYSVNSHWFRLRNLDSGSWSRRGS